MDPKHSHGPDRIDYQEAPGDLTDVHASLLRENPEPTAQVTPIPMWLTILCLIAFLWAGFYFGLFNGGLRADVFNELTSNASLLFPPPAKGGPVGPTPEVSLAEMGKRDYATCQACHQQSGAGQPGVIPPLAKSPFVVGSEKRLAAIMLKGVKGPINVNGVVFNNQMQAWEGAMNDKKLAGIATYIRSAFGNAAPPINAAQFAAARKEFAAHKDQLTEAEILAISEDATLPGADAGGNSASPTAAPGTTTPPTTTPAPATTTAPAATPPAATPAPAVADPGVKPLPGNPPPATPVPGTPAAGTPPPAAAVAATPEQMAAGKTVYMGTCMACHQITGAGMFPLAPPLTKSPYVNGPVDRFVAMILKGNLPPMTIDGKVYAAVPMPAQEAAKTDEEIAAVATYVRGSFENTSGPVTKEQVAAVRAKFADRKTSWTQPELDAWKE